MPRDTRTRRLSRPASGGPFPTGRRAAQGTAVQPLISLLAKSTRLIDLLPHLHQQALDVAGGDCSLLFEFNPGNGVMQATSGSGLDELVTDPWNPGPEEGSLVSDAFGRGAPMLVPDARRQMPDLTRRLGTRSALLLPLAVEDQRVGLLAVGFYTPPA